MFGWVSTQPLPSRLEELLERCAAVGRGWQERQPDDALIFLPPDQVVASGRLPYEAILTSYRMLLKASEQAAHAGNRAVLVNGDRLLALSAEDLVAWRTDLPLPRASTTQMPDPLHAALAAVLLRAAPELLELYRALEERSERGRAEVDANYLERLESADPNSLVQAWNRQLERRTAETDLELLRLQLQEIEQECERQFLQARDLEGQLSQYRCHQKHALEQLNRYRELVFRALRMQARSL
jgi:hypothetical protein